MTTSLFIAKRYLLSKKSVNAINIISAISTLGVLVCSAALIIILSVFNGFEHLVLNMFSVLSPELRIEPAEGKTFNPASFDQPSILKHPSVLHYTEVLQEKALLRYKQNQYIATIKGISKQESRNIELGNMLEYGLDSLFINGHPTAIMGAAVQAYLGISPSNEFSKIQVFSPKKNAGSSLNPADEFTVREIDAVGTLKAQPQFDDYLLVPLSFAQSLLGETKELSAIELDLKEGVSIPKFQKEISSALGPDFVVKNKVQQNPTLYKILNSEKWAVFFILTFVLIVAILNIIGSLSMLVIDKQKDIQVLRSLGANNSFIKLIFFSEGIFISLSGCILGIVTGLLFCVLQIKYGIVKMDGTDLITDTYPVKMKPSDFFLVFGTVLIISIIASWVSSRLSLKQSPDLL